MTSKITIFRNTKENRCSFSREVEHILERIKNGASKDLVKESERATQGRANELKKQLPGNLF